jgi:dsDNA-specific endonuclease/ATPase MutS2
MITDVEAWKEYKKFLSIYGLDDTSELAAVYFNARAHNLMDNEMTELQYKEACVEYNVWQKLSREYYNDALRTIKSLIAMEE